VSFDPAEHRRVSAEHWQEAAPGWTRRQEMMRQFAAPVSRWLVDALHPQPGHRVLELAAGIGDTGFLAAESIVPGGKLICTDQSEGMLDAARARAGSLGLEDVEFRVINAEWIDLPVAGVDGVVCRWGYMLMADPGAALAETRRVLRPGGRVALAVWDRLERNPWAALPALALREHGVARDPDPGAPGPFALSDAARVAELLREAGFADAEVQALDIEQHHANFDAFWETALDIGRGFHDAVLGLPQAQADDIRNDLRRLTAPFGTPEGALTIPGRTLVATAEA